MGNRVSKRRWYKELKVIQSEPNRELIMRLANRAMRILNDGSRPKDTSLVNVIKNHFWNMLGGGHEFTVTPSPHVQRKVTYDALQNYIVKLEQDLAFARTELHTERNNAAARNSSRERYRKVRHDLWSSTVTTKPWVTPPDAQG